MANPIATYREVTSRGKRTFELHTDHVIVRGRLVVEAVEFESIVRLADLRPEPNRIWLRNRSVRCVPFLVLTGILAAFTSADRLTDWLRTGVIVLGICSAIAGIVLWAKSLSKIEYAQFPSPAGLVLLDVGRSGPDQIQFHGFVKMLFEHIRVAQSK